MKHLLFALCMSSATTPAISANQSVDIKNILGDEQIISASVIFVPDNVSFNVQLNQENLLDKGCRFFSSNQDQISYLINGIDSNKFYEKPHIKFWDKRQAIIFNTISGTDKVFVFGNTTTGYLGDFTETKGDHNLKTLQISSNSTLTNFLYKWANTATQVFHTKEKSDGIDQTCKDLIGQ